MGLILLEGRESVDGGEGGGVEETEGGGGEVA